MTKSNKMYSRNKKKIVDETTLVFEHRTEERRNETKRKSINLGFIRTFSFFHLAV